MQFAEMKYESILFMFETNEESDCNDIEFYLNKHRDFIGKPDKIICLDSGTCDYNMIQMTTTQRGGLTFEIETNEVQEEQYMDDF